METGIVMQETLLNTEDISSSCLFKVWHTIKDVLDKL
jgi:hypothetical protein